LRKHWVRNRHRAVKGVCASGFFRREKEIARESFMPLKGEKTKEKVWPERIKSGR